MEKNDKKGSKLYKFFTRTIRPLFTLTLSVLFSYKWVSKYFNELFSFKLRNLYSMTPWPRNAHFFRRKTHVTCVLNLDFHAYNPGKRAFGEIKSCLLKQIWAHFTTREIPLQFRTDRLQAALTKIPGSCFASCYYAWNVWKTGAKRPESQVLGILTGRSVQKKRPWAKFLHYTNVLITDPAWSVSFPLVLRKLN